MDWLYPLYYQIYRLNISTTFHIMAIAVVIWAVLSRWPGRKRNGLWKGSNGAAAAVFLFIILYYTVLCRGLSLHRNIVMRPFASLETAKKQPEIYRSLTMNTFLFFPLGLFLSQLFPNRWGVLPKLLLTVFAGFLYSVLIEALQYYLICGDVETDDIISNTVGTLFGALNLPIAALLNRVLPKKKTE